MATRIEEQGEAQGTATGGRRPGVRRGILLLSVAFAVILLAELGARAIAPRLPDPLQWHSYEAQVKVAQMDELARAGGADVVFLGTSQMNSALEPVRFMEKFHGEVTAYNGALSQSLPRVSLPWASSVVFPRLDPKVVVIGLSSLDLVPEGPGRAEMLDGFSGSDAAKIELGTASTIERIDHWLGEHSALVRHRSQLRDPGDMLRALLGKGPKTAAEQNLIGPFGFQTYSVDQTFETRDGRAAAAMRDAVLSYEIGGPDVTALRALIERAQHEGARVLLVTMPVTTEYVQMHPAGADDYEVFETALSGTARATDTEVLDLNDMGERDHALFADENHLNGRGTNRFTDELAEALLTLGFIPDPAG